MAAKQIPASLNPANEWPEHGRAIMLFVATGVLALVRFKIHGDELSVLGGIGALNLVVASVNAAIAAASWRLTGKLPRLVLAAAIGGALVGAGMATWKISLGASLGAMLYQIVSHIFVGWLVGYGFADKRYYMLSLAGFLIVIELAAFFLHLNGMLE